MGYVSSASSVYLDVHLTNYGRGVVLSGDLKNRIVKFGLSDGDIDYRLPTNTGHTATSQGGLLPDVTGNHVDCASGVNDGFKMSSKLHQVTTPADPGEQTAQVVVGIDKDLTGTKTYYSDSEVEVYIHDYYVLCKLLSHLYAEDHTLLYNSLGGGGSSTYGNFQNAFLSSFSANSSISSGTWKKETIKTALELVGSKYRGQFVDFWDCIKVNYSNLGLVEEKISITSSNQTYMNNAAAVSGRLALESKNCNNSQYLTDQKGYNSGLLYNIKGNNDGVSVSPFTLAFSHGENGKKGAGAAGIGFTTTEFGYLVLGKGVAWGSSPDSATGGYKSYPATFSNYTTATNYDKKKYFLGFVHPVEFENAPEFDGTIATTSSVNIPVKGYDEQDNQTKTTYQIVSTVLPALKYGFTKPPTAPIITADDKIKTSAEKLIHEYEQSFSNSTNSTQLSNFYYPIKESRASTVKEVINLNKYKWATTNMPEYHQSTYTDNALDTFSLLGTNLEYTNVTKSGYKIGVEGETSPSIQALYSLNSEDVKQGKHYYNWFGRMMITGDEFFRALYQNYDLGNASFPTITSQYSARTGTAGVSQLDDFNIKIPMEFKIYSEDNPQALPATCKVTIVYNKRAAQQSIGYSGFSDFSSSDPNVPYWRIYDRTIPVGATTYNDRKPRFYGEDGENINAYTSDPTQVSTTGNKDTGKRIFRKVLAGGTVIQ
jgi:hypothetical protein